MNIADNSESPATLLTFKVPRINSGVGAFLSLGFGIMLAVVLANSGAATSFPGAVLWIFTPIPVVGVLYFAKAFTSPPTEFQATSSGVLVFLKDGKFTSEGVLVPWQSIQAVSYERFRRQRGAVCHSVILSLREKNASFNGLGALERENAVHLEAWSAKRGQVLAQQLSQLLARYGTVSAERQSQLR